MVHTALASVTFRKLTIKEIIDLVRRTKLDGIEWGGDIHVPHGNLKIAEIVNKKTEDAGLEVVSYGSYYKLGMSDQKSVKFKDILHTAKSLKAPNIRIWAGIKSSTSVSVAERKKMVLECKCLADMAIDNGMTLSFEYHDQTMTDTSDSSLSFLKDIDRENVYCYWQPHVGKSEIYNLKSIKKILKYISNVHVFYWFPDKNSRNLLEDGQKQWNSYLKYLKNTKTQRYAIIEFVKDDKRINFIRDAATLTKMLRNLYT